MQEDTCKKIKKSLCFEKSKEAFHVEIAMKNVRPGIETATIVSFLETSFKNAIEDLRA